MYYNYYAIVMRNCILTIMNLLLYNILYKAREHNFNIIFEGIYVFLVIINNNLRDFA